MNKPHGSDGDGARGQDGLISLGKAARSLPGNPAPTSVWRWCRKGVRAANGERVRLEHCRYGKRLFTTNSWLSDFAARLAANDVAYFEGKEAAGKQLPPRDPRYDLRGPGTRKGDHTDVPPDGHAPKRKGDVDDIDAELDREGL